MIGRSNCHIGFTLFTNVSKAGRSGKKSQIISQHGKESGQYFYLAAFQSLGDLNGGQGRQEQDLLVIGGIAAAFHSDSPLKTGYAVHRQTVFFSPGYFVSRGAKSLR